MSDEKERVYTVTEGVLDELGDLAERLDVIRRLCDGCGEDTFRGLEIARLIAPDAKPLILLVEVGGLEPPAPCLQSRCSAN
jgi:hypothetical protein